MNPPRFFLIVPALVFALVLAILPEGRIATELFAESEKPSPKEKLSVLLIDGQNNHAWQETTPVMVDILERSGRFTVTVSTSPPAAPRAPRRPNDATPEANRAFADAMKEWETAVAALKKENALLWEQWRPDFSAHDVVLSNYNGESWPDDVKRALEDYVGTGGGFVAVHAANNSFPEWREYNRMIGLGGWGGRDERSGPYLRLRGASWEPDRTPGRGGAHGKQHEFLIKTQDTEHPITQGLPEKWMHAQDELYDRLRGPAENVTVLASAFASEETGGSGEWEPMLMVIDYLQGRVFHTTLGHSTVSMQGVGFQETLKRGTEWAATGSVSFPPVAPEELPADRVALR